MEREKVYTEPTRDDILRNLKVVLRRAVMEVGFNGTDAVIMYYEVMDGLDETKNSSSLEY